MGAVVAKGECNQDRRMAGNEDRPGREVDACNLAHTIGGGRGEWGSHALSSWSKGCKEKGVFPCCPLHDDRMCLPLPLALLDRVEAKQSPRSDRLSAGHLHLIATKCPIRFCLC